VLRVSRCAYRAAPSDAAPSDDAPSDAARRSPRVGATRLGFPRHAPLFCEHVSAPLEPSAFRLRAVHQSFAYALGLKRREVLGAIDLELARGRRLGLAGPNGSGKSTILRLLAGVDRARRGEVEVLGGSPADPSIRRRIGYLPEDSPFPRELGARAALELLAALQGMQRAECRNRGDELLERVGLADRARTRLARFSRGMLRRFGLAQAWLGAPELVLLDEPTAGLDAQGFEVLEDLLGEAHARGASLVIASHLPADIETHCDKLAVILDGAIAACGAPRELLREKTLLDLYRGLSAGARSEA
jgi:ABC-type multidrug transport system ATPase subunit